MDGGDLAYLGAGPRDGHPVLLLHGIPTSSWLYRTIAPRLAADGLRAVAPDLLGFGANDKPRGREAYSARRQADRLVALLDHLALPAATLVVHDVGGPWGFEIADRHPGRVAGLVVLNTTAYADAFTPPRDVRMLGGFLGPAMLAMMRSPLGRPMIHRMPAGLTHTGEDLGRAATEPHWQALREGGTAALRAFAQDLDGFTGEFERCAAALRRLEVPAAGRLGCRRGLRPRRRGMTPQSRRGHSRRRTRRTASATSSRPAPVSSESCPPETRCVTVSSASTVQSSRPSAGPWITCTRLG